jgi:3-phenylpropionate/trans-cinnamate dioxygenase ferredoxin reductase component
VTGRTFVIVGGSMAGATAAATLRERGFDGRLVLLGDEPDLPYERPGLSKRYLRGEQRRDEIVVRPDGWWQDHDVDVLLGTTVERVDPVDRVVRLAEGGGVPFDAALATGGRTSPGSASTGSSSCAASATPIRSAAGRRPPGEPSSSGWDSSVQRSPRRSASWVST